MTFPITNLEVLVNVHIQQVQGESLQAPIRVSIPTLTQTEDVLCMLPKIRRVSWMTRWETRSGGVCTCERARVKELT